MYSANLGALSNILQHTVISKSKPDRAVNHMNTERVGEVPRHDGKFTVLHAWDVAGVATMLGRTMDRKYGTRTKVLMRRKYDPFGFDPDAVGDGVYWFYLKLAFTARNADVLHVHSGEQIFHMLHRIYRKKPILMHYHGSDIRSKATPGVRGKASHIFYSTKDLAKYFQPGEATWCPNPIDRKFYRRVGTPKSPKAAVSFNLNKVEETKLIADKFGLELDILERKYHWTEIPKLLSQYSYYLDIKEDPMTHEIFRSEDSLSMTALQALSIGLHVIDANGRVYDEFPEENDAENVAELVHTVYRRLLTK